MELELANGVLRAKSPGSPLLWGDWEACMWLADAGLQPCSWGEVDSDDTTQDVHLNHSLPKQTTLYGTDKVNGHD